MKNGKAGVLWERARTLSQNQPNEWEISNELIDRNQSHLNANWAHGSTHIRCLAKKNI